jgi:CBS domain-containing protein
MPKSFNFSAAPFDGLTNEQQQWVRNTVDIGYYPAGEVILSPQDQPQSLFVIIKGHVQQTEQGEVVCVYSKDECFDGRSLISGQVSGIFTAAEELIVYLVPKDTVQRLIAANATFSALLFSDLSQKMRALGERRTQRELHSLMLSRIDQAFVRPARFVDERFDVFSVAQLLEKEKLSHVLVQGDGRVGIFTTTDIRRALLADRNPHEFPVGQLTTWTLVEADHQASVFDALILMIRHGVHRVVVKRQGKIMGVIEQLDLLSFISNHSHLIWVQIQQAQSLDELKHACAAISRLIGLLSESEVKVSLIARLVQELNAKVYTKLWQFTAPQELIDNSCLIVMGSEGRAEQILKTDQDNGLILRNGFHCADLSQITSAFNDALYDFGYPPCLGGIMMRNPLWCQSLENFKETVRQWVFHPNSETHMRLAIFADAVSVCGDHTLLAELKEYFFHCLQDMPSFFAHFARAADSFSEQSNWWSRILTGGTGNEELDIKKLGIFPIVHGIRSLALEARLALTTTSERIEALVLLHRIPEDLATDLQESLHFLMDVRLKQGLCQMALDQRPTNLVALSSLSTLERDLLRDSLQVVKRFRGVLHFHFKLGTL